MQVKVNHKVVEPPPIESITVTFTADEYFKLAIICGCVGGTGVLRSVSDEIYDTCKKLLAPRGMGQHPQYKELFNTVHTHMVLKG